jgi:predicted SAM-dependent methyltransferase
MSFLKSFKNIARKSFFHPFGYDVVPLKKENASKTTKQQRAVSAPGQTEFDLDHYKELFGKEAVAQRAFYNIGAGPNFAHPAWTNVDHPSEWYGEEHVHIAWDMLALSPLPIENNSASIFYTSYALEHVTDEACQYFLAEAYRTLRPGGILRLLVPDIDIYAAAYQLGDRSPFYKAKNDGAQYPNAKYASNPNEASLEQNFIWSFASSVSELHVDGSPERVSDEAFRSVMAKQGMDAALNFCTAKCSLEVQRKHPGNHINWYNENKLARMMRKAGFDTVYRSGFQQSRSPVLRDTRLFDFRRPEIGLYMEAIK